MQPGSKKNGNWLLRGLIILSLAVHAVILVRIADLYRTDTLSAIELTLQNVSGPSQRNIPRPPRTVKAPPMPKKVERLKVTERPAPSLTPLKVDPVAIPHPEGLAEPMGASDSPSAAPPAVAAWLPGENGKAFNPLETRGSYFELVRLSIESHKKYPGAARNGRIEGRVTVGFVISLDGTIGQVNILKKSRSRYLDEAALQAVREAAPFPKPPRSLFKGEVRLAITIVFELT